MILLQLAKARELVAAVEKRIAKQIAVISELEKRGEDATSSHDVLSWLKKMQALHVSRRDRLEKVLKESASSNRF